MLLGGVDNLQNEWPPSLGSISLLESRTTSSVTTCFLFVAIFLLLLFQIDLGIAKGTSPTVELSVADGALVTWFVNSLLLRCPGQ